MCNIASIAGKFSVLNYIISGFGLLNSGLESDFYYIKYYNITQYSSQSWTMIL